ncbi:hypothetical protein [Iningainema tapete]|uniref:Uncharacterized protein n=1 Tax=Iningainema tapete BLCC-T55 TaxID=2748662 RepID=A0A8J7CHN8_9CYAN|nr:hypothetical protein [Iningainema tapete]MBD2777855.1 hypothetical protein [Iningainema tapete BLCC-T55]
MANLISKAIARISSVLNGFQVKRFVGVVLVGFLLLTTNAAPESTADAVTAKVKEVVNQNDSQRPKTTGQWNREARETEGNPGERVKKIAKESAEAVKDFGKLYPDTIERSANADQ